MEVRIELVLQVPVQVGQVVSYREHVIHVLRPRKDREQGKNRRYRVAISVLMHVLFEERNHRLCKYLNEHIE
jgi:hypothetical protein